MEELRPEIDETTLSEADRELVESFQQAWDDMAEAVRNLSSEDQERFVNELREAIDGGIRRRVEWLDQEAKSSDTA